MRSSLVRMRSSLVVRASDCQCTRCNGPGFDPSIRRHSGIWGAADETVLNTVRKKYRKNPPKKYIKKIKKNLRLSLPLPSMMKIKLPLRTCWCIQIIWISYFLFRLLNILKPELFTLISYCWTASHWSSDFVLFGQNWASWIGNGCKMEFWDILII